jgi:thiol:disulfide interchange protein DsbD
MRYWIAFFLLCSSMVSAGEGDLLEPEQAFKISARALDGQTLEVRYQIAEGYYLYKEKFKFQVEPSDVILGTPQLPAGKVKQDEYFGKVETYRHDLVIRLPYTRGSASRITLKAVSQGCADVGVCYPPQTQVVKVALPGVQVEAEKKPFFLKMLGGGQGHRQGHPAGQFHDRRKLLFVSRQDQVLPEGRRRQHRCGDPAPGRDQG